MNSQSSRTKPKESEGSTQNTYGSYGIAKEQLYTGE
jgi:hypothetical protein